MCFSINWRSSEQVLKPVKPFFSIICVRSRKGFWLFVPKIMISGAKEEGAKGLETDMCREGDEKLLAYPLVAPITAIITNSINTTPPLFYPKTTTILAYNTFSFRKPSFYKLHRYYILQPFPLFNLKIFLCFLNIVQSPFYNRPPS